MDWTRVPVVVGAGQVTNREQDPAAAPDPFELMAEAARRRRRRQPRRAPAGWCWAASPTCFMVHSLSLRHGDPAPELARRLGADGAEARCSGMGGVDPAVARQPGRRARGRRRPAPCPHRRGRGPGHPPPRPQAGRRARLARPDGLARHVAPARARPGGAPRRACPRARARPPPCTRWWSRRWPTPRATTPHAQRRAIGALMARFNAVAADNPVSWFPTRRDAARDHDGHARQPHDLLPLPQVRERRDGRGHGRGRDRHRRGHGARLGARPRRGRLPVGLGRRP